MAIFVIYDVNLSKKILTIEASAAIYFCLYQRSSHYALLPALLFCKTNSKREEFFCPLEMILIPYVNFSINRPMSYREAIQMTKINKPITQLPPSFFIRCKWLLTNLPFAMTYNLEFESTLFCPRWPPSKLVRPGLLLLSFVWTFWIKAICLVSFNYTRFRTWAWIWNYLNWLEPA